MSVQADCDAGTLYVSQHTSTGTLYALAIMLIIDVPTSAIT